MSFGAEIKEFLEGFQAGNKMVTDRVNARTDRELKQAQAEKLRAGPTALEVEDTRSQIDLRNAQAKKALQGDDNTARDTYYAAQTEAAKALAEVRRVGIGEGQEDFGAISDAYESPVPEASGSALPYAPVTPKTPAQDAARAQAIGGDIPDAPKNTRDIIAEAGIMSFAPEEGATPKTALPTAAPAAPAGQKRLPKGTIETLWAKIDPDGTMPEAERNFRAFSHLYKYYSERGEGDKAKKAAGDLYRHFKDTSGQYAAFAKAAVDSGDMDQAAKAVEKYYANIPDGIALKAGKDKKGNYTFSFTDLGTGKVVQEGAASPKELAAAIMGIVPGDFEEYIAGAAGLEYSEAAPGGAPIKPSDLETLQNQIDAVMSPEAPPREDGGEITAQDQMEWNQARNVALYMTTENKLTAQDATDITQAFLSINKDDPGAKPWRSMQPVDGGKVVTMNNGQSVFFSEENFARLVSLRQLKHRAANQALVDQTNEAGEPGFLDRLSKRVGSTSALPPPTFGGSPMPQGGYGTVIPTPSLPTRVPLPQQPGERNPFAIPVR